MTTLDGSTPESASVRSVIVEADGGSRGNPGPAGFGAVVRDEASGRVLAEVAEAIGVATNNVAEYRGLIAGLSRAAELGARTVAVRMDSKLVVEQLSGRWQVKHPDMKPLARQAMSLVRGFESVSFTWVPRARNSHADRLANEAMDAAAQGRVWAPPPTAAASSPPAAAGVAAGAAAGTTNRLSGWMAADAPPTVTIWLRHGQTPMSVAKRFSGIGPAELTETGVAQAKSAAARLAHRGGIDAVVCSPLARAKATADLAAAALGLPVTVEDGLRETDFGAWEGYTFAEVQQRWPGELAEWLASDTVAPPGGESFAATTRRVRRARDQILMAHPGRTVLVVTHVTPVKTVVRLALEAPPAALYRLHVDLTSVTEIDWYADGPAVLRLFNDTSHLTAATP